MGTEVEETKKSMKWWALLWWLLKTRLELGIPPSMEPSSGKGTVVFSGLATGPQKTGDSQSMELSLDHLSITPEWGLDHGPRRSFVGRGRDQTPELGIAFAY